MNKAEEKYPIRLVRGLRNPGSLQDIACILWQVVYQEIEI